MPLISIPTGLRIRAANWQQPPLMIRQRSAWTGRTREVALGPAQRWTCDVELTQMRATDLTVARGWLAALSMAGNDTRLEAVEASQTDSANFITNSDLAAGTEGWVLPAEVTRVAGGGGTPIDWYFRAGEAGGAYNIIPNNGGTFPLDGAEVLYIHVWGYREGNPSHSQIYAQWFDAAGAALDTTAVGSASPDLFDTWVLQRHVAAAPAGAVSAAVFMQFAVPGPGGFTGVGNFTVSRGPSSVLAASGSGTSLVLAGLEPSSTILPAGSLLTVEYPSGGRQLFVLAADLVSAADGSAIALLASPLREAVAAGTVAVLDRPYALMRPTSGVAWSVSPGPVYSVPAIPFEESF